MSIEKLRALREKKRLAQNQFDKKIFALMKKICPIGSHGRLCKGQWSCRVVVIDHNESWGRIFVKNTTTGTIHKLHDYDVAQEYQPAGKEAL